MRTGTSTAKETSGGTWTRRSWWNRRRTVVVAAPLTGAVVYLVGMLLGVDPQVRAGEGTLEVTVGLVVGASLTAVLAGWGVRSLLLRTRSGGRGAWFAVCGVVLAVSLLGPLGAANPGATVLLALEHLAVGAVIALGLSGAGGAGARTTAGQRA
ncbi:DUF6069 family protein [Isoptericola sp. 4D.3]|uniref:DUF6069 family protein n=1 Tax=Isoptericola peretonis TaxID=2918523 RepID=A0ABT0J7Q8_9MICO|nr:DUF6069 family protein [Isoptericola sp. 4D.3]